ncbi:MAG: hypothetical protein EAZ57_04500 [Cytophagales bacterium]|nr:MAG: hypothetical protein EAZ67_05520 [Cytophagales bacterium]TAF61256.1 MAG: hypothetical protein EAZ57_04500 [Cytophagales bacterium]
MRLKLRMSLYTVIDGVLPCGEGPWVEHLLWFGGITNNPIISSTAASTIPNRWDLCFGQHQNTTTLFTAEIPGYPTALLSAVVYTWSVTGGGVIIEGAGTDQIEVQWNPPSDALGAVGTVGVAVSNGCGAPKIDVDNWR